jgi:hypothetical protein
MGYTNLGMEVLNRFLWSLAMLRRDYTIQTQVPYVILHLESYNIVYSTS